MKKPKPVKVVSEAAEKPCPKCGYCQHCGQSKQVTFITTPYVPYIYQQTAPYWVNPVISWGSSTSSGTFTSGPSNQMSRNLGAQQSLGSIQDLNTYNGNLGLQGSLGSLQTAANLSCT